MAASPLPLSGIVLGIVWTICASRRRHDIGGWLLFFYIQMYASLAIRVMAVVGASFPVEALPLLLVRLAEVAIATWMLRSRTWPLVIRLRWLLALDLLLCAVTFAADLWRQSPDAVFDVLDLLWPAIWLPYFVRSTRVWAVFKDHSWEATFQPSARGFEMK